MKPRLRRLYGMWVCRGKGVVGFGPSPRAAYGDWEGCCFRIVDRPYFMPTVADVGEPSSWPGLDLLATEGPHGTN